VLRSVYPYCAIIGEFAARSECDRDFHDRRVAIAVARRQGHYQRYDQIAIGLDADERAEGGWQHHTYFQQSSHGGDIRRHRLASLVLHRRHDHRLWRRNKNDWYQPFWGDADRLANGNVLITAGVRGSGTESRVFEVTKADGKVVWEFRLGPDIGIYRAERITPPLVKAIPQ